MKGGAFHDLSETSKKKKKCQWAEQFPLEETEVEVSR